MRSRRSRRHFLFPAFLLFGLPWQSSVQANVIRRIEADEDKVALVRTAVGFSTILEFPSKPLSAVLGDQDSFKLEYVGNSITVKPLVSGATSNLFVFTEYNRFTCTLKSGAKSDVDDILQDRAIGLKKETHKAEMRRRKKMNLSSIALQSWRF